jgi:hypothetical protein
MATLPLLATRPRPQATKGQAVPQPTRLRLTVPHALGLCVFVATAALFAGAAINRVVAGLGDVQAMAIAFSDAASAVGALAMSFDAYDLWVRGRLMNAATVRGIRSIVFVAVLAALATTMMGRDLSLVLYLGPAIVIYFLMARQSGGLAAQRRDAAPRAGSTAAARPAAKSRQRRGGKKRT